MEPIAVTDEDFTPDELAKHEALVALLMDVGYSWGMPEAGIMQLAELIESIFTSD